MRKRPHHDYKVVEYARRVDVIYDQQVHGLSLHEIADKHAVNYNTVRFIVNNYKMHHRINLKKKKSGYFKK